MNLIYFWFDFCFTALRHILSFRARSVNLATLFLGKPPRQFTSTYCTFFRQLLFLNQRKKENGRRNVFMTKSARKTVPDVGIEVGAACMPSELASDRATASGPDILHHIELMRIGIKKIVFDNLLAKTVFLTSTFRQERT